MDRQRNMEPAVFTLKHTYLSPDPAVALLSDWKRAQRVSLVLCRLQQRLETRIIRALGFRGQVPVEQCPQNEKAHKLNKQREVDELLHKEGSNKDAPTKWAIQTDEQIAQWDAMDEEIGYSLTREAEIIATTEVLKFQDTLPATTAQSFAGIIAKLEIIMGADRDIGDPTDFPWPHIASVLRDLKTIIGSLPIERHDRAIIRADAVGYRATASNQRKKAGAEREGSPLGE
ncbi:hypothetical protein SAMN04488498_11553 [Mesorhizobium albiziae]|uniref:Uncharacterized protein n=1 Tax=Neomesorhizobium albiziae TaxID=335020 RepID=A0A1I4D1Q3_9HYPH|nr:hypothetical protein [Mesorhizobium albiziae]GLS28381.1 hypothetical protein GCM10007937_00880 [Mesorhizobium albiziae]SFK86669.1 hypothetical protein SAMN04488498_11553 [Mesorhizobium albiziae]